MLNNLHVDMLGKAKPSWLYPIYVPSYSRAGKAPLLNMLHDAPKKVQRKVHIVVRPDDADDYRAAYPWATVVEEGIPGIGPARMACLKDADNRGYQNLVMLDDDILHVSLLERITRDNGTEHTRRYSSRVSGIVEPGLLIRSLAVGCKLAGAVFEDNEQVSYGAARNALFSGDVNTEIGATLNKGSFPACVMFFDVNRFQLRDMPTSYQWHGEDLAMFLHTLSVGNEAFTLPGVAYDQSGYIETTIPLDPQDSVARTPDLESAEQEYPTIFPYLRASFKNKAGGIMRIGVNWKKWYKDTGTEPVEISTEDLIDDREGM